MNQSLRTLVVLVLLATAWPATAFAGAWSPAPGHGYAKLWLKWLLGFGYNAGDGKRYDYGAYHELFLNGYGEIGIAPRLAMTLHFPLAEFFSLEDPRNGEKERHFTVGDPALGARYQLLSLGRLAASVEAYARAPVSPSGEKQVVYERETDKPIGALRIGTGVWDLYAGGALGYGWDRIYLSGSAGYIARTGGYHDVINWASEVGGRYSERWSGRFRMTGYHSLDNGTAPRHNSPSGIGNGTRYLGFSIETEYQFKPRWYAGLSLEGGGGLLSRQTGGPVTSAYVATTW